MQNWKSNTGWERGHGPRDHEPGGRNLEPSLRMGHPRPPHVNTDAGIEFVSQQIVDLRDELLTSIAELRQQVHGNATER